MIFLLILPCVLSEIVYFIEVSRHGARAPSTFMEWDTDRWPDGESTLTPEGMRQHYLIGTFLRQRYITDNPLLPQTYNSTLLYAVSSTAQRTQDSLQSQLLGLYPYIPQELRVDPLPPVKVTGTYGVDYPYNVATFAINIFQKDPMLHCKDLCPAYDKYAKGRKASPGMKRILGEYSDILEVVEKRYGVSRADAEELIFDVIASIRSNKFAGYLWDPVFDDAFVERAQELYMRNKWYSGYSPDYIARFVGSDFFNDVNAQLRDVKSGKMVRKASIYSAHDTTLFSILASLGMFPVEQPPFATVMLFEVVKEGGEYFVRVLYNMEEIIIPGCALALCGIDTFIGYVEQRVFSDTKKACKGISTDAIKDEDVLEYSIENQEFTVFNTAVCLAEILILGYVIAKKLKN